MALISPQLREGVQKLFAKLSDPSTAGTTKGPTVAETKMTGPQASEARWPKFALSSDEPESIGGTERAPTPSSMFVASIGFAENVIFARQAVLRGVDFDSLETKVEALWDRKGMFGIDGVDPSITDLLIETRVTTDARVEDVAELVRLTHRRSPLTATLAKAAAVRRRLFVNGLEADASVLV